MATVMVGDATAGILENCEFFEDLQRKSIGTIYERLSIH
jgi:hypothetical protein